MLKAKFIKSQKLLIYLQNKTGLNQKKIQKNKKYIKKIKVKKNVKKKWEKSSYQIQKMKINKIMKNEKDCFYLLKQMISININVNYQSYYFQYSCADKQQQMNRFKNILSRTAPSLIKQEPVAQTKGVQTTYPKKFDQYRKDGPELLIARIISIHGPLQNKQIWRVYQRMNKQNDKHGRPQKLDYFASLTRLKKTIRLMRISQKLKSNGYDRKAKQFKGWKLNQVKAFKYVHPQAIKKIQQLKNNKDLL